MINNNSNKSNIKYGEINNITDEAISATPEVVGLYPSIPQEVNPESL